MKYIRLFNENLQIDRKNSFEKIKEFCEENLAYLIDAGFGIYIGDIIDIHGKYRKYMEIALYKKGEMKFFDGDWYEEEDINFNWNDVKDDFIPFIQILSTKYKLTDRIVLHTPFTVLTINDLVDDKVDDIFKGELYRIGFLIEI